MGCWYETCGVTQLPIMENDPVALILLTYCNTHQDPRYPANHAGHCHSNDVWSPRALPIHAKYNDYGGIDNWEENWNTEWIIKQFQQDLIEKTVGENSIHDPATPRAELSVETLMEWIHDSRVEIKNPIHGRSSPIGFMMVHGWVWDQLSSSMISPLDDEVPLATVINDGKEFYNKIVDLFADSVNSDPEWLPHRIDSLVPHTNPFNNFSRNSGSRLDSYGVITGIRQYRDLLVSYAEKNLAIDDPLVIGLITELAKYLCFNSRMDVLRKTYSPQAGKGSQNQNFEEHTKLMQGAIDWMTAKKASYDE